MKLLSSFLLLFTMNAAIAGNVKVLKLKGRDSYILRGSEKLPLKSKSEINSGDEIHVGKTNLVIEIGQGAELNLGRKAILRVQEVSDTSSTTELRSGMVKVKVTPNKKQEVDHKMQAGQVFLTARDAEYEVALAKTNDVDAKVFKGQIEASSPLIQSFVPEYIKAKEAIHFSLKEKKFVRKK